MTVDFLSDKDKELYNKFVQEHTHGSLFQSLGWQHYQEKAFGLKSFILTGKNEGISRNSALIFQYPLPFGKSYLYAPRGPLFSEIKEENEELLQRINLFAQEQNAIFFRFDPLISISSSPEEDTRPAFVQTTERASKTGMTKSLSLLERYINTQTLLETKSPQPKATLILDLTKSEEEILAQMKEKGRYNIRLAEKKGVQVRSGTVEELYPLLQQTAVRDGFHIHNSNVYQTMLDSFSDTSLLLVAMYEEKVIAGGIFLFDKNTGIYYYGASSNEHRQLMAPYLVQWKAIQEGRKRGCQTYDFLGIAETSSGPKHPWAGVTEFKRKFGGEKREYVGAWEFSYQKFWHWLYRLRKKM